MSDEDVILDADAAPTGDIDGGFDSDDHAGFEDILRVRADARRLVDFQADPVAKPMGKTIAELDVSSGAQLGCCDDLACRSIHVLRLDAGTDLGQGGVLSIEDDLIDFLE